MECEYFGTCGSCTVYEISYEAELLQKKEHVLGLLSPFGVKDLEVFSANASHYRARSEFKIWHDGEVCSYAMGRLDKKGAVNIVECPKVIVPIEKRMRPLLEKINASKVLKNRLFSVEFLATTRDECLITMIYHRKLEEDWTREAKELEQLLNAKVMGRSRKQKVILSDEFVTEKLLIDGQDYLYQHYESGFTQPNPAVNIHMIEWAIKQAKKVKAKGDFLESYCGLGNFTLPLSKYFDRVLATEISKRSIYAAKENCVLNNITNIEFIRLASEEMTQALNKEREFTRLQGLDLDTYNFSTVLVDPPRAGLDKDTIKLIQGIENIIYISCNPETLARDLLELTKTHDIDDAAIYDQFPHTYHVESGVFLRKK
ncbi:MAG: tRNA (uracil(54)-C5)-methyltransferase (EC [uncultured Sulfurovum sp.]|uniref:tRNA (Uracil(54)-C5)-methyltransferase (EC) n=1 Tax=uncultured Sulfurovum sp. TaxID=269237 RepID=A0A6S6TDC4_9BACT|nr:MAG: tRNA (uracil(54)-C5)-methyltransferase (EC [uncultured Sulfurovum sp.]